MSSVRPNQAPPPSNCRDASYPKLSNGSNGDSKSSSRQRGLHSRRNPQACLNCRARKIRCNVMKTAPCSHCQMDNVRCVVAVRRRNRRTRRSTPLKTVSATAPAHYADSKPKAEAQGNGVSCGMIGGPANDVPDQDVVVDEPQSKHPSFIKPPSCHVKQRHLQFLRAEGALSLPSWRSQRAMVEAFATFSYSYLPVVDLKELLNALQHYDSTSTAPTIGLLLYQSILYAGSGFVDADRFEKVSGAFASRKAARAELSQRVTVLYDLGYACDDDIEMIQAAIIMSCGSQTASDWKNSWYWLGQAISLALAVGLNLEPLQKDGVDLEPSRSSQPRLRRRIWWTCYMRDRFLSLGLNRSTRIRDQDCTTQPLSLGDFDFITVDGTLATSLATQEFTALFQDLAKQVELAEICIHRLRLSQVVEIVTRVQEAYDRPENEIAAAEADGWLDNEFSRAEAALEYWHFSLPLSCVYEKSPTAERGSKAVIVSRSHMHMAFQALKYTLHRPRFLPTSPRRRDPTAKLSSDISGARTISSAIHISLMTQELDHLGLVRYLPVSGVTVMFPAMAISLLEIKMPNTIQQQWAAQRFMIGFKAMGDLIELYHTAEAAVEYLKKALQAASLDLDAVLLAAGHHEDDLMTDFMQTWHPALLLDESVANEHEIMGETNEGIETPFVNEAPELHLPLPTLARTDYNSSSTAVSETGSEDMAMRWDLEFSNTEFFKGLEQLV